MIVSETYYFDLLKMNDADGIEFEPSTNKNIAYKLYKNTPQGRIYLEVFKTPMGKNYFLEDIDYADVETGKCS